MLRTIVQGKRRDIGLGGCKLVTLAEARETALTFRKIARAGGDPLAERRKQRMVIPTFEQAARSVHAEHLPTWKISSTARNGSTRFPNMCFPFSETCPSIK
jgi:Arm DNA-binding domain